MGKRTQKHNLRHLTKELYSEIRSTALKVTALYNDGLCCYAQRKRERDYLHPNYIAMLSAVKEYASYRALNTSLASITIMKLAGDIERAITRCDNGTRKTSTLKQRDLRRPSTIYIPNANINRNKGFITLPGRRGTGRKARRIPFPPSIDKRNWKKIDEVKIVPKMNGAYYQIHITLADKRRYPRGKTIEAATKVMTIDPGVDNMITCTAFETEPGKEDVLGCRIWDGKELKSRSEYLRRRCNEIYSEIVKLKEGKPKRWKRRVNRHYKAMRRAYEKRRTMMEWMTKTYAARLVQWAKSMEVEFIAFSWSDGFKQRVGDGLKNNFLYQMPLARLRNDIRSACYRAGIGFGTFEESYTSKASALAVDEVPSYANGPHDANFSGERVGRGLYVVVINGVRYELNADVNANLNQLEKCKPGSRRALLGRLGLAGLVAAVSRPQRERLLNNGIVITSRRRRSVHRPPSLSRRSNNSQQGTTLIKKSGIQASPQTC